MLSKNIYDTIVAPIYSEKATVALELSKYTFKVSSNATKNSVKVAIEKIFSVKVKSVNIMNVKGQSRVFRGVKGRSSGIRKAIVTLDAGMVIEFDKGV